MRTCAPPPLLPCYPGASACRSVSSRLQPFMPDKPLWLDRIPDALQALAKSPRPWVERATLETLLGVRRRRAQQILAQLATEKRGRAVLVEKTALIAHLRRLTAGEDAFYEQQRRQRLAKQLAEDRRRWLTAPPVLVEPPPALVQAVRRKDFAGLPAGVDLAPGQITVTFTTADEALEKLLALALAVGQNREGFEERVGWPQAENALV